MKLVSIDFDGKNYSLETGRFAKQANSVMVRCGDSMVLVTAVASERKIDADFLPLQVEYRFRFASSGKIPGGFIKREGRPSDNEILSARLIDRPLRPMLPKTWRYDTQVIATIFSYDPAVDPDTLAAVGASAAVLISDIPFTGPFSEVRVGRINGEFIVNPSTEQLTQSELDMTVSGTNDAITMVEGESSEISEQLFLDALVFAHEKIKILNALQLQLVEGLEITKREVLADVAPEEIISVIKNAINDELKIYVHSITSKKERNETRKSILEKALAAVTEQFGENEELKDKIQKYTEEVVSKLEKAEMRNMILTDRIRLDGRALDQIRPISCETGLLPRTHGSALFTRGETQSLTTCTLGTKRDELMIDGLMPTFFNQFYLHYNFPPFCTGETGRLGTGRREIGHGNLAQRALQKMLPSSDDFPYVIRIVSEILESNGSSSMATVCAGSLALYDAGVPMKKAVAGIAMGLIKDEDRVAVLSDILGDEDFLGDMDFKVTGTIDGITACQMDIKIGGLSLEILTEALDQARRGRLHILNIMNEKLNVPNTELSQYAPRFTAIHIPTEFIGAVIGSGGETIRSITKETGTEINIEDDGTITIAATSKEAADAAIKIIQGLTLSPEEGTIYTATVKEIREGLGAIMEFLPKKQGLLHISQIAHERTENVSDHLKVGDKIEVKLVEITREGKFRLSRKALLPRPEGMPEYHHSEGGGDRPHHPRRDDDRNSSRPPYRRDNDRRR
ncbi:MAG: polyribonucleotide nucleotidyltransferase [Candidatus Kapabacteria bacterium]|nr:polyribonucleotide nucleotidyltransferase [Candidatus Kapabacteria bacterium]